MLKTSKPISDTLKSEWDTSKNTHIDVEKISSGSGKKAWWRCCLGHSWEAVIASRTDGRGCPYCSNRMVWKGFNDLETLYPEVAKSWVISLNPILPSEITAGSSTKIFWWGCEHGHQWKSSIYDRINNKNPCPYCANRTLLKGFNDLATVYPDIAQEWNHTKNNLRPDQVFSSDQKSVYWICVNKHEWKTKVFHRTVGQSNCPKCSFAICGKERSRKAAKSNSFEAIHPEVATSWSEKNLPLLPSSVSANSHKMFYWECALGHEWKSSVAVRVRQKSCPYCVNSKVLTGYNDLTTVNPKLAKEWHPTKNSISILEVHAGSKHHVWWQCLKCEHEWTAGIVDRNVGNGCPNCKRVKASIRQATPTPGLNDFATVNPHLLSEWSSENTFHPEDIKSGSKRKVIWACSVVNTHRWESAAKARTRGGGCPLCSTARQTSKAEDDLHDFLVDSGLVVERRNKTLLKGKEIDLYLPDYNFGIEYNGLYWHSEMAGKTQMYHADKYHAARHAGVELFNVWEDDWVGNRALVLRTIFRRIGELGRLSSVTGVDYNKQSDASSFTIASVVPKDANDFFEEHHLLGETEAGEYLGLVDESGINVAIIAFAQTNIPGQVRILRYASSHQATDGFARLLACIGEQYEVKSYIADIQLGSEPEDYYSAYGFSLSKEMEPDFSYVFRNRRTNPGQYTISRFRSDASLKFQDGLSHDELVTLNRLYVIWDAGSNRYMKSN